MRKMLKLKFVFTVIICILCTVSCKTVKEIEGEEVSSGVSGASTLAYLDSMPPEVLWTIQLDAKSARCKELITVFPNPTSSSATINVDLPIYDANMSKSLFRFKYNIIFDEKIIFEDDIPSCDGKIIIPEHLLQLNGVYIIAYEVHLGIELIVCRHC